MSFGPSARRVARRKQADADHATSIALMKWLSKQTKSLGIAQHVYIVGGAVRNFVLDQPIKDIDMVVDSLALRGGRDSEWVAQRLAQRIPGSAMPKIHTSNLGGVHHQDHRRLAARRQPDEGQGHRHRERP